MVYNIAYVDSILPATSCSDPGYLILRYHHTILGTCYFVTIIQYYIQGTWYLVIRVTFIRMEEAHASDTSDGIDDASIITAPSTADVTTTPIPKQRMASSDASTTSTSSPSDVTTTPIPQPALSLWFSPQYLWTLNFIDIICTCAFHVQIFLFKIENLFAHENMCACADVNFWVGLERL